MDEGNSKTKVRRAKITDAFEIALVHVKSWRTTYKNLIPESYLSALSIEKKMKKWEDRLTKRENGKLFTYVAVRESQSVVKKSKIVGFSLGSLEQQSSMGKRLQEELYEGELRAI